MECMESRMQDRYEAFDKEMLAAIEADGEKLRAMTGEDHGPWPVITDESPARSAVRLVFGAKALTLALVLSTVHMAAHRAGGLRTRNTTCKKAVADSMTGRILTQYGVLLPSGNPIARMMAQEADKV